MIENVAIDKRDVGGHQQEEHEELLDREGARQLARGEGGPLRPLGEDLGRQLGRQRSLPTAPARTIGATVRRIGGSRIVDISSRLRNVSSHSRRRIGPDDPGPHQSPASCRRRRVARP